MLVDFFIEQIKKADSIDRLDEIIEEAADAIENNNDYHRVYTLAISKAQSWQAINR